MTLESGAIARQASLSGVSAVSGATAAAAPTVAAVSAAGVAAAAATAGTQDSATVAMRGSAAQPVPLIAAKPIRPETLTAANAILASVGSPDDTAPALPGIKLDLEQYFTSWRQFPAFLQQLKQIQDADPQHRPVVLDLNVHGNNGTGLKLAVPKADGSLAASIASVAWVNREIRKAGFTPETLIVTSEACNGGHSYTTTIDGMDDDKRDDAAKQAKDLVHEEGGAKWLAGVELFDVLPSKPGQHVTAEADREITWIGRPQGVNYGGTVLAQVLSKHGLPGTVRAGAAAQLRHRAGAVFGRVVPRDSVLVVQNRLVSPQVSEHEVTWPRDHRQLFVGKIVKQAPERQVDDQPAVPAAPLTEGPEPTETRAGEAPPAPATTVDKGELLDPYPPNEGKPVNQPHLPDNQ